jgi:hypothetical protein
MAIFSINRVSNVIMWFRFRLFSSLPVEIEKRGNIVSES